MKESASHFEEMRQKYSRPTGRQSPTGSMTSSTSTTSAEDDHRMQDLRLVSNCFVFSKMSYAHFLIYFSKLCNVNTEEKQVENG